MLPGDWLENLAIPGRCTLLGGTLRSLEIRYLTNKLLSYIRKTDSTAKKRRNWRESSSNKLTTGHEIEPALKIVSSMMSQGTYLYSIDRESWCKPMPFLGIWRDDQSSLERITSTFDRIHNLGLGVNGYSPIQYDRPLGL